MEREESRPVWSENPLVADLERGLIWSQAQMMANHAEVLHRTADRVGTRSRLADLLDSEARRLLDGVEQEELRPSEQADRQV